MAICPFMSNNINLVNCRNDCALYTHLGCSLRNDYKFVETNQKLERLGNAIDILSNVINKKIH